MKHIKIYESFNDTKIDEIKKDDIVVCNRNFFEPSDDDYERSPKFGRKYIVSKIISNMFLSLIDLETNEYMGSWNKMYFIPEFESNAYKYNL